MSDNKLQPPHQSVARNILRIGGILFVLAGLIFTGIGLASFFSAFGSRQSPEYFWCAFVGMPLLFVGIVMCNLGFLGAISRYITSEQAPVAKDAINYLAEETKDGVKTVAKAVAEGIQEAQKEKSDGK